MGLLKFESYYKEHNIYKVKENLLCDYELSGKFLHLPAFGCFIGSIGDIMESGADGPDIEVDKNRSIWLSNTLTDAVERFTLIEAAGSLEDMLGVWWILVNIFPSSTSEIVSFGSDGLLIDAVFIGFYRRRRRQESRTKFASETPIAVVTIFIDSITVNWHGK